MSYDLTAFRPADGVPLPEVLDALRDDQAPARRAACVRPVGAASAVRVEAALVGELGLAKFERGREMAAKWAEYGGIDAEALGRFSELSSPDEGGGIGLEVSLVDDETSVSLPYWHDGAAAEEALRQIGGCVRVFEQEGLRVYDPQLGRVLEPGERVDASGARAIYRRVVEQVERGVDEGLAENPE